MSQSLWSIRLRNSHALHHLSREYLARVCRDQSSVHSCSRTLCHAQQTSCTWLRSGCQVLGASGYVAKQVRQSNLTMHCSPVRGLQQQRRVMPFRPGMCQHGVSRMHSKLNPASSRVRCGAASPSVVLQLEAEVEDLCLATVRDALQLPGHLPPVKGLDVVLRGAPHSSLEAGAGWQAVDALQRGGWCWLASRGCDTPAVTAGREAQELSTPCKGSPVTASRTHKRERLQTGCSSPRRRRGTAGTCACQVADQAQHAGMQALLLQPPTPWVGPLTAQEHSQVASAWPVTLLSKQPLPRGSSGLRSPREQTAAYASPCDSCTPDPGVSVKAVRAHTSYQALRCRSQTSVTCCLLRGPTSACKMELGALCCILRPCQLEIQG